jgi:Tol biopolymer transport system component
MRKQSNVTWTLILLILVSSACSAEGPASPAATLPPVPTSTDAPALTSTPVFTSTAETPVAVPTRTPAASPTPIGGGSGKIAFISNYEGDYAIYVMNVDGGNPIRLTEGTAQDDVIPDLCCMAWSPDRSRIAFSVLSKNRESWDIYVMNADGSEETRLTMNGRNNMSPFWSPDGNKIVFTSSSSGDSQIYVMNADGSEQTGLTNNDMFNLAPAWSPHGTKIAYESKERDNPAANEEIYVMNTDGSDPLQLTNNNVQDLSPAWSPDGTKIAYSTTLSHLNAEYNPDIYVMNYDGSNPIRLTSDRTHEGAPSWSPDGNKIAYGSCQGETESAICDIYIMNADGSDQSQLTDLHSFTSGPVWSPSLQNAITQHSDCTSGWSRLKVGDQTRVSQETNTPNRVREGPSTADAIIGVLDPGTVMKVIEGPVCADGLIFWKVEHKSIPGSTGWTAEGDGTEYWLEPHVP